MQRFKGRQYDSGRTTGPVGQERQLFKGEFLEAHDNATSSRETEHPASGLSAVSQEDRGAARKLRAEVAFSQDRNSQKRQYAAFIGANT